MDYDELYPSKFMRASDLAGPLPVVVGGIARETVGNEQKVVMTFSTGEKNLILNKTNGGIMKKLFGSNTANWLNKPVTLVPTEVDFKGEMVAAIRISRSTPARAAATAHAVHDGPNDDIGI